MAKADKKKKKNKPKHQPLGSVDAQVVRSFSGSLNLTRLESVIQTKKGEKGDVRCLVIPIDKNFLLEKDGQVYLDISIKLKDKKDQYGQDGFIGQSVASPIYKEASEKQKEKMKNTPILGNFKDWDNNGGSSVSETPTQEFDENDDLPF